MSIRLLIPILIFSFILVACAGQQQPLPKRGFKIVKLSQSDLPPTKKEVIHNSCSDTRMGHKVWGESQLDNIIDDEHDKRESVVYFESFSDAPGEPMWGHCRYEVKKAKRVQMVTKPKMMIPQVAKASDRDGDGIRDSRDKCPDTPGEIRFQGCPPTDRDKDGVFDHEDLCPDTPGPAETKGCPAIKDEEKKKFSGTIKGINFEVNSTKILSSSYKILDEAANLLKDYPYIKLEIQGHTDSQGSDTYNLRLSQKRAEAVLRYLTRKGVAGNRLRARGYGEKEPIAKNTTRAGRAKNRRIEFVMID